jgi:hypothetical protein
MTFKRVEYFTGCLPQRFIDKNVPNCPTCESSNPHWTLSEKVIDVPRYLFKCQNCACIISSPISDVNNFSRAILTSIGCSKEYVEKIRGTIKLKIESVGDTQTACVNSNTEIKLTDLESFIE